MRRAAFLAPLIPLLLATGLRAQALPPVPPDAVGPDVAAAIAQYVSEADYAYAGDCQSVGADSAGLVCSVVFTQDDGSAQVQFFQVGDDGTPAQPNFAAFSIPAPFSLIFIQSLPSGSFPQFPPDRVFYEFRLTGTQGVSLGDALKSGFTVASSAGCDSPEALGRGYTYLGQGRLIIALSQSAPSDTYTIGLTLPDGRHTEGQFVHNGSSAAVPSVTSPFTLSFARRLPLGENNLAQPNQATFEFLTAGIDPGPLSTNLCSRKLLTVEGTPATFFWTFGHNHGQFLLVVPDGIPAGAYTLVLVLKDGRRAAATFDAPGSTDSRAAGVVFLRAYPVGEAPFHMTWANPERGPYYEFAVNGLSLCGQPLRDVSVQPTVPFSWERSPSLCYAVEVRLPTSTPPGSYVLSVSLPDGRTVTTSFIYPSSPP